MPGSFDTDSVDSGSSLTLVVGWRSGQKTKLGQLILGETVREAMQRTIEGTLVDLAERSCETWTPEADLTPETYLRASVAELGDAPILATIHQGLSFREALLTAEALPLLAPKDLPAAELSFYAITVGDAPGQRTAFLRRTNPRRGLRSGRILSSYHDVLTRIEDPVFSFDSLIDIVFSFDDVYVLSQTAFAALFRSHETLMAQVPGWTKDLAANVSISKEGQERLTAKAIRDSRIKTRLEAIVRRRHLSEVRPDVIVSRLFDVGLDAERLLDKTGSFILEAEDIADVLQFLNEDLFVGALTNTGFRADKKAQR